MMDINKKFYYVLMLVGIICILDFLFLLSIGIVMNVGIILPAVLGVLLIAFSYFKIYRNVIFVRNVYLSRVILIIISLFIISFISVEALIWSSTKDESDKKADFVVLLGAGLKGDKITATFMNRMVNCVRYMEANPETKVVVTGGQGYGETISEARAMKNYLVEQGIEEDRILEEDRATSTFENFRFSREVLKRNFGDRKYTIMIITNDFHMFRSKLIARRNGFVAYGMPAKTWWGVFPNSCIREYFAVVKSYFVDR